jgi:urease accessory protein
MRMTSNSLLALLQFSDGTFPTGAYAHSCGLETLVQDGSVYDAAGTEKFLRCYLEGTVGRTDAAAAVIAMRAAAGNDLVACLELDAALEAMKPAAEMRAASRQLGRQALRIATALLHDSLLMQFARRSDKDATPCHHAVVFGIAGAAFGWRPIDAAAAYLHSAAAAITGAALRLIPLGQTQGQVILRALAPLITSLAGDAIVMSVGDLSSFAPALEIAAMRHAHLEARLFRS